MKIHELEQNDKFKVVVYDNSPVFKYLGDYRHGYDHYTGENIMGEKYYFSSVTEVTKE